MGQDSSAPVDESVPPQTLESRTLEGLAKYIKSPQCKRIVVMSGAGISTSAGIPDFRSPDTGLYHNLARLNLPYAEAVFDISFFRKDPLPFYTLASELYPGRFRPTITHSFISLLHSKSLLLKHFTQNIDCLDREAGVPDSHIIEAHGSFARQSCIDCHASYPADAMRRAVDAKSPPHCDECSGLVKPEIVFFGEALPPAFFENRELPAESDLCIVMGTSLTVQPFASLPQLIPDHVPRMLINKEVVGGLGSRPDDVLLLGDCDEGVKKLAKACGWLEELEYMWSKTKATEAREQLVKEEKRAANEEMSLNDEVEKLTKEIDETLKISEKHQQDTKAQLERGSHNGSRADGEVKTGDLEKNITAHLRGKTENRDMKGPSEARTSDGSGSHKTAAGTPSGEKIQEETNDTLQHVYPHSKSNLS